MNKLMCALKAFCIIIILLFIRNPVLIHASSADIVISSEKTEYIKGDTINVYIDIEAEVLPGDFEGYFLYNADLLEYVGGNTVITGGEGILKISDQVLSPTRNNRRYSLRFTAKGAGECEFKFSNTPELYEFEEGYLMSVSISELKITVTAEKEASGDGTLAVLKISPGTLVPGFSADVKEYRTDVPISTEKLIVSAVASDPKAEVSVSGNSELRYGNNRIEIMVKAENGDITKYIIICERAGTSEDGGDAEITSKPSDNNDEINNNNPGSDGFDKNEKSSGIKAEYNGSGIKIFTDNVYTVSNTDEIENFDEELLSDYKKTSLMIDGISIPVYVSESSDEYMLIPLKNEFGETYLYSYDRIEKTLQKYKKRTDEKKVNVMTNSIEALELTNSYEKSLNTMTLIIAILSGLSMALLIVVIRLALKNRNGGLDD